MGGGEVSSWLKNSSSLAMGVGVVIPALRMRLVGVPCGVSSSDSVVLGLRVIAMGVDGNTTGAGLKKRLNVQTLANKKKEHVNMWQKTNVRFKSVRSCSVLNT